MDASVVVQVFVLGMLVLTCCFLLALKLLMDAAFKAGYKCGWLDKEKGVNAWQEVCQHGLGYNEIRNKRCLKDNVEKW